MKYNKTILSIVLIILIIGSIILYTQIKKENYETVIEENETEYDDLLEKNIDKVKKEIPGSDAELLLEVNKPWNADKEDEKGWYGDVINCKNNGDNGLYCKPKDKWIFPY